MVGGKKWRVIIQDAPDGGRFFKHLRQKPPDPASAPALGMDKLPIQGEVACIEIHHIQASGFVAVGGKIEDGQIEKIDRRCMVKGKIQSPKGTAFIFRRCSEEQIDVGSDARLVNSVERL